MKFSNFFIPTLKDVSGDIKMKSHDLMIRSGMIRQETSGIYTWLPLGYKILKKIIKIIEVFHDQEGINQILMPTIQSSEIWKISNRYDSYGKEMLKIRDRHNKELLYGPTNEEMITAIAKQYIKTYKSLPRNFYHIQTKFRDEIRPRFGVMRAREFIMKDAYSFDTNEENGESTYLKFYNLYLKIFQELNIPVIPVRAPSGEIGGDLSHEFHLVVESGESEIFIDEDLLNTNFNQLSLKQILALGSFTDEYYKQINSPKGFKSFKSIELGHIFLFGKKYSSAFKFDIDSKKGKFHPYMGSYGIGVSRIPAAVIEFSNDKDGIIWPKSLAPFSIHLINVLNDDLESSKYCNKIYDDLIKNNIDVIFDDRLESVGKKFSDADLIGVPILIICGRNFKEFNEISVVERENKVEKKVKSEDLVAFLIKNVKENL